MGNGVLDKFNLFKGDTTTMNTDTKTYLCNGLKIIRPNELNTEVIKIIELIKKGNMVAFNLENLTSEDGQRMVDYLTGATSALGGRIEKVTDKVYISVPAGVDSQSLETEEAL